MTGHHLHTVKNSGVCLLVTLMAGLVALFAFRAFPNIDYLVSDPFFKEVTCKPLVEGKRCGWFPLIDDGFWQGIRDVGLQFPRILMLLLCFWLVWLVNARPQKAPGDIKLPIAGILSAAVGPLLVAGFILKEHWGRPRPLHTLEFGGNQPFVLPGTISDLCPTNCSFVSGEATAAFWLLIFALFFSGWKRLLAMGIIGAVALEIAILRIIFGRHFMSDITMSFFVAVSSIFFALWLVETKVANRWIESLFRLSIRPYFERFADKKLD